MLNASQCAMLRQVSMTASPMPRSFDASGGPALPQQMSSDVKCDGAKSSKAFPACLKKNETF